MGVPLTANGRRIKALKNMHAGKRGFVLGNGPSLLSTDPGLLKDEVTIASNGIFLLFDETSFRPTFYTVEDTLVAEDRAQSINALKGFTKVIPEDLKSHIHPDGDTLYINFVRGFYPGFPKMSTNLSNRANWGGTVTFLNLQLAWYLGLNPIYLIGVDHNYAPPKPEDQVDGVVIESKTEDVNHFHPDYFGPGYRWHDPRVDRMEMGYQAARKFFDSQKVQCFNATAGGKLEVFDRVDYHTLFPKTEGLEHAT
ncbi:6-hydroxymethylpterin diphosphokinase MptE-like protein [Bremerella sp. JC770]|uniref:6-hydroxymethylpterin diphosphokinase MptE-like protein n=1 Tax=Bremerella sp. JC770 TaxID=3232137 RepID=UPI00345ABD56